MKEDFNIASAGTSTALVTATFTITIQRPVINLPHVNIGESASHPTLAVARGLQGGFYRGAFWRGNTLRSLAERAETRLKCL